MANGDGLMAIARADLDPLEKFALGFLSSAEQNQRKRYAEEAKFVREKTAQIKDRVDKQTALYAGMKAETKTQIDELRSVAPGLSDNAILGILRGGKDNVKRALNDMRKDREVNAADMSRAGRSIYIELDGELRQAGPEIYQKRDGVMAAEKLARRMFRAPGRVDTPQQQENDFASAVASFFGAPTDTASLVNQARKNALDVRGYGTGVSGTDMGAASGIQEFFAAGGSASNLRRTSPGIAVTTAPPEKRPNRTIASRAVALFREDLNDEAKTNQKNYEAMKAIEQNLLNKPRDKITKQDEQTLQDAIAKFEKSNRAVVLYNKLLTVGAKLVDDLAESQTSGPREQQFITNYTTDKDGEKALLSRDELQKLMQQYNLSQVSAARIFEAGMLGDTGQQ